MQVDAGYESVHEREVRVFVARVRSVVEALLASHAIDAGSVRVGVSGPRIFTVRSSVESRIKVLRALSGPDLMKVTFNFDLKSDTGTRFNDYLHEAELKAAPAPLSPHFVFLSRIAHAFIAHTAVAPGGGKEMTGELMAYVRGTTALSPLVVKVARTEYRYHLDAPASAYVDPARRSAVPQKPPAQVLAEGARDMRRDLARAGLGGAERLHALDSLARDAIRTCLADQRRHVHSVLGHVRRVLNRVDDTVAALQEVVLSEADKDKLLAAFSSAVGLKKLKAEALRKGRQRSGHNVLFV